MQSKVKTVQEYIDEVPIERRDYFMQLRATIVDSISPGFTEQMNYGMIGYVVPLDLYPKGYHCKAGEPLPFVNIASQKHFIGFYHLGLYAVAELNSWFESQYKKHSKYSLDRGKSCIRLKKMDHIPYALIGELMGKISLNQWIKIYEESLRR